VWPATTSRTARRLQNNVERPQRPQFGPRQQVGKRCRRRPTKRHLKLARLALQVFGGRVDAWHFYLGQRTSKPRATFAPDLEVWVLVSGACRARSWCGDKRILARIPPAAL
jgi:hypothetical protein